MRTLIPCPVCRNPNGIWDDTTFVDQHLRCYACDTIFLHAEVVREHITKTRTNTDPYEYIITAGTIVIPWFEYRGRLFSYSKEVLNREIRVHGAACSVICPNTFRSKIVFGRARESEKYPTVVFVPFKYQLKTKIGDQYYNCIGLEIKQTNLLATTT